MSACIIVTQLVITVTAAWIGRRAAAKDENHSCSSASVSYQYAELFTPSHMLWERSLRFRRSTEWRMLYSALSRSWLSKTGLRDGPLQCGCGITCDHGWYRGCREHNNRWRVDSASRVPSVLSGLASIALLAFALLWFAVLKPSLILLRMQHQNPKLNPQQKRKR